MPIYEYQCRKCDLEFELLMFGNEVPVCPKCGSGDVEKRMSSFGFSTGNRFKSSGPGKSCAGCTSSNCSTCS